MIGKQICRAKTSFETSQTQQLVEPTKQNKQHPSGIIATQPSKFATEQTVQPSSAIAAPQPIQTAELGNNSPLQGAALTSSMVSTSSNAGQNVRRLPKLILPIFYENPLYWQSFWDS